MTGYAPLTMFWVIEGERNVLIRISWFVVVIPFNAGPFLLSNECLEMEFGSGYIPFKIGYEC